MKRKYILTICSILTLAILTVSCGDTASGTDSSFDYLTKGEGDWTIKIDDISIPQTTFESDLVAFLKIRGATEDQIALAKNDNATKQGYAEQVISDILLLRQAETDGFFETEEAKALMEASIRNIKVQYYTQSLMLEASKNIPDPTEDQARAFFVQARAQIAQTYNITEFTTETRPAINQLYKVAFAQELVQRDMSDLKDKSIIDRNDAVLGDRSLISTPQQMNQGTQVTPQNQVLPRGDTN